MSKTHNKTSLTEKRETMKTIVVDRLSISDTLWGLTIHEQASWGNKPGYKKTTTMITKNGHHQE